MTKVAINRCFGGFGLSEKAFEKLLERKGIAFDKVDKGESSFIGASYYQAGHAGDDDYYISNYEHCEDRSDPDLIAVIEEMGQASWSWAAEIAIIEIPDDVKWHIHEYDGMEHIAEDHRTWS
jgi:hypothetical protein